MNTKNKTARRTPIETAEFAFQPWVKTTGMILWAVAAQSHDTDAQARAAKALPHFIQAARFDLTYAAN
jgi:hypothetical protein